LMKAFKKNKKIGESMFKIGDFSRLSRVSVKALRYYDEIGLLKPAAIDSATGYRYYAAEQFTQLNRIIILKEAGLSLDEIGTLLDTDLSVPKISGIIRGRITAIREQVNETAVRLDRLEEWLKEIDKEGKMPEYQVTLKKVEPLLAASIREVIPVYSDISRLYEELFKYLGKSFAFPSGPAMAIYHDTEYKERDADVEAVVPVKRKVRGTARIKVGELPCVPQMACVLHKGDYSSLGRAYQAMTAWIEKNGYHITGNSREVYIQGPGRSRSDPTSYITEVQFPVEK